MDGQSQRGAKQEAYAAEKSIDRPAERNQREIRWSDVIEIE